jgi:acyl dehydratase
VTVHDDQAYEDRLQRCVQDATGVTRACRHAVSEAMIAMWADALMDKNPVYADRAAAVATGRPGVIAPPTMIQAWAMPPLSQMAGGMRSVPGYAPYWSDETRREPDDPGYAAHSVLAEGGFTTSAATNCRQVYHRELIPGDRLHCTTTLDGITPLKRTSMGPGHFVTSRMDYLDGDDEPVASQLWTVLQFRPPADGSAPPAGRAPAAPAPPATQPSAGSPLAANPLSADPQVGQRTDDLVIPITPTFVIATALATHDFYAIHHDTDWARSVGRPNIFTNILTTTGLVGRVLTDWAGPATRLRSVDLRLLVPNYPGDVLTLAGTVTAVSARDVTLQVTGTNSLGRHVQATVVGTVPGA